MPCQEETVRNEASVKAIYEAFASGDLQSITRHMSPDILWDIPAQSADLEWLRPRLGHSGVFAFFRSLEQLEFEQFSVKSILTGGNIVVALLDIRAVVLNTGHIIADEDEVHIWRFDPDGLVVQFRHKLDTHQHILASQLR